MVENIIAILYIVAPYAGAWIETRICPCPRPAITVAPYAGAWIETVKLVQTEAVMTVAPYAGAWIETGGACPRFFSSLGSLPTRERGLKHYKHLIMIGRAKSLPTRERGLKHYKHLLMIGRAKSLPTRERGLKPPTVAHPSGTRQRRSLRGSVD